MIIEKGYYFTVLAPGYVVIHEDIAELRYDEQSLRQRIENVKRSHADYASDAMYQTELRMLNQAMEALKAGQA